MKNTHFNELDDENEASCICILDQRKRSEYLKTKLSDLPRKTKILILNRAYFLRKEQILELVYEKHSIDLKRDRLLLIDYAKINWTIIETLPEIKMDWEIIHNVFVSSYIEFKHLKRIYDTHLVVFSDKQWIVSLFSKIRDEGKAQDVVSFICSRLEEKLKKDIEIAYLAGKLDYRSLGYFDVVIKEDRELAKKLVKHDGWVLNYFDKKFLKDLPIITTALRTSWRFLSQIKDDEFLKYWIDKHPCDYRSLPSQKRWSFSVQAVKKGALTLQNYGERWYGEVFTKEIVIEALKLDPKSFSRGEKMFPGSFDKFLRESANKEFYKEAVRECPSVLYNEFDYFDPRTDVDIARECVQRNGLLLQYFSEGIRQNVEIASLAVNQNIEAIQYCELESSMIDVTISLPTCDIEIAKQAVQRNGLFLEYFGSNIKECVQIVQMAIAQNGCAIKFASDELRKDRKLAIEALNNGCPFMYLDPILRKDRDIVLIALRKDSRTFKLIDGCLQIDEEIVTIYKQSFSYWNIDISDFVIKSKHSKASQHVSLEFGTVLQ